MKTERRDSSSTNTQLHFKTQEMLKHETRRKNLFSAWLQKQTWKTKTSHPLSDARCRIKTVEQEGEQEGERWTDIFKDETNVGGVWERSRRRGSPQVFGAASASHSRTGPPAWTFHQLKTFKPLQNKKKILHPAKLLSQIISPDVSTMLCFLILSSFPSVQWKRLQKTFLTCRSLD